ncbi:MAG: DUF2059 domain-containing protein [Gammaproteobacteria bacterium]
MAILAASVALGCGGVARAALAAAASSTIGRSEQIVELLDLTGVLASASATSEQVTGRLRSANPEIPPETWTRYAALVSDRATLVALYTPIYARHLSDEDIAGLLVFYRSPVGSHLREALPKIAAESQVASQQLVGRIALELSDDENRESQTPLHALPSPAKSARTAEVETLLRESGTLAQAQSAMRSMLDRLREGAAGQDLPPSFWQRAASRLTDDSTLLQLWTPFYVAHFPAADVHALIAFYRSRVGVDYVQAQAAIQDESVAAVTTLSNTSARQAVRETLGPLPQWRLQHPPSTKEGTQSR